jgi:CheY-like chemotaxis protein
VRSFEPFYQEGARSGQRRGIGLGLPIAKHLVERMGGQIGIESEPGQGSLVWFQLSLSKQKGAEPWRVETAPLKGKRLIIVDDVASSRGMLVDVASGWGMQVSTAEEPMQALEMLQVGAHTGTPFDFLLVDYDLPGLGGLGLAEAVLDDPATASTRVILIVPHSQQNWQDEPLLVGLEAVIAKPVRVMQLLELLLSLEENRRCAEVARLDEHIRRSEEPGKPQTERPKVLVVEDNVVNQKVAVRLVEKMGCRVELSANGQEALSAIARDTFDLVLMDCQMPVMDGFEATAAIRGLEGDVRSIPVIAMTANAMQGDRERCLAAGMDDYLSKPVSYEDLKSMVNRWLARTGRMS